MSEGLENIDKLFKDAFDGFEANVDPSVWTNVQNAVGGGATGTADGTPKIDPSSIASSGMKALVAKIAVGVAVVGTLGTAGYFIVESVNNSDESISENVMVDELVEENTNTPEFTSVTEETTKEEVASIDALEEQTNEPTSEPQSLEPSLNVEEDNSSTPTEENVVVEKENNTGQNETMTNQSIDEPSTNEEESSTTEATPEMVTKEEPKEEKTVEEPKEEKSPEIIPTPKEEPQKVEAQVDLIPNVITPNGDRKNDVIKVSGVNLKNIEVVIMDKTGKPVYRIQSLDDQWNGKDQNGYDLIPGIYYLAGVVVDADGNTKNIKKTVNLLR